MITKFLRRAGHGSAARDEHPGERPPAARQPGRACCCPARPVIQVIMPATASRPHQTELLLCAHHYRVSRRALDVAGAAVLVLPDCPGDAMLCDDDARVPDPVLR